MTRALSVRSARPRHNPAQRSTTPYATARPPPTGRSVMTQHRGRYDPRPRHPNRQAEPESLRDLLRQYIEERNWNDLLAQAASNGHGPDGTTSVRHDRE